LLIFPFGQRHFQPCFSIFVANPPNTTRCGLFTFELHSPTPLLQLSVGRAALNFNHVNFWYFAARVQKPLGKLAVVRQQQCPTGMEIKPADRMYSLWHTRNKLPNRCPSFWVMHG